MDIFYFALILTFCAGSILIMYAMYNFHGEGIVDEFGDRSDYFVQSIENKLKDMNMPETNPDYVYDEFSDLSNTVFKEMEEKHQELLFLYKLIDEKKNELSAFEVHKAVDNLSSKGVDVSVNDNMPPKYKNPRLKEIIELKNSGLTVAEIAKKLDIGQGEVSLIMEIGKGR